MNRWAVAAAVLCTALVSLSCRPDPANDTVRADPLDGRTLQGEVIAYTKFGGHRTGSEGDLQTSSWLAGELRSAGFDVELQGWPLDRFELSECTASVGDLEIECFPFWLPPVLENGEVRADLVRVTLDGAGAEFEGKIAFADAATVGGGHFKLGVSEEILASGAVGAIYVVASDTREVVAQNAIPPFDRRSLPIPAVIVGQKGEAPLIRAAENGEEVRLKIDGALSHGVEALNVIGRLERGPRWIVVSTPTSGWFDCGGERGPGVALWLALARWAAHHDSETSFLFVGTSGHELDYMGAHVFADSDKVPPPADVITWLHLGASIGVRLWEESAGGWQPLATANPGNLVASQEIVPTLEKTFLAVPGYVPRSGDSKGELRVVLENGYRAFGLYGGHLWFHTPRDGAGCTEAALLEPIARACAASLEVVEQQFATSM